MSLDRISIGIKGLDEILGGGLIANQAYLVRGKPGSGKTILGFHFLNAGIVEGETVLFITFGESEPRLRRNAKLIGIDLEKANFLDLSPQADFFTKNQLYDIFSTADVEREPVTNSIIEQIDKIKPQRVFLDAITQFRYLVGDDFQFRQQVLSFLQFILDREITLLLTSEASDRHPDDDLQFMSDGVIQLCSTAKEGSLVINKFRGSGFLRGNQELLISDRGMEVFPCLISETPQRGFSLETISSGIPEIDELLHGGIERGTVTIITGPSGLGKSTFCLQFMKEAAGRGERTLFLSFEERVETILHRCQAVSIPAQMMEKSGNLSLVSIEPLKYSPARFLHLVRQEIEENNTTIVAIDSTAGYKLLLQDKEDLVPQLNLLCQYLKNMGVTVMLINETETIAGGEFKATEVGISYLADNIVFLRYLELGGQLRKAIGVLKKRISDFERNLREFRITKDGIRVGESLTKLRGILSGVPTWIEEPRGRLQDESSIAPSTPKSE